MSIMTRDGRLIVQRVVLGGFESQVNACTSPTDLDVPGLCFTGWYSCLDSYSQIDSSATDAECDCGVGNTVHTIRDSFRHAVPL